MNHLSFRISIREVKSMLSPDLRHLMSTSPSPTEKVSTLTTSLSPNGVSNSKIERPPLAREGETQETPTIKTQTAISMERDSQRETREDSMEEDEMKRSSSGI